VPVRPHSCSLQFKSSQSSQSSQSSHQLLILFSRRTTVNKNIASNPISPTKIQHTVRLQYNMPTQVKMTIEYFHMLEAKRKRFEQESMDADPPVTVNKRPPSRDVDFGAADLIRNDTGGVHQEGQDDKEEEMIRRDDTSRHKGDEITEEAIDGPQHDDEVNNGQERNDSHLGASRQKRTKKSFDEHLEELKAFKEKHGHVRVTVKHNKSLGWFCKNMRTARRGTGKRRGITEDRIKALDELGFDWRDKKKSFEARLEELKVFKAKHGHIPSEKGDF